MRNRLVAALAVLSIAAIIVGSFLFQGLTAPCIVFLCGAGMKRPVLEIAKNFERETGIRVLTHFEGSAILRDHILKFGLGDVFLPGDKKNLDILSEKGLVKESSFIAWHEVAILVSPQFEGTIDGLDDLASEGVRLALSNPRLASLGRLVMERIINRHPDGKKILDNIVVYGSSSQDILALYNTGNIDAVIEWNVMAATPEGKGLAVVQLKDPYAVRDPLVLGLLTTSKKPDLAGRFYEYVTGKGREVFRKHGYDTKE